MSEFWLISVPGDKTNLAALERMNTVTAKASLSENSKFIIPDLKVGTLDALIGLSDDLGKLDVFAESVIKKIAQYIGEIMDDSAEKAQENLLANGVIKHTAIKMTFRSSIDLHQTLVLLGKLLVSRGEALLCMDIRPSCTRTDTSISVPRVLRTLLAEPFLPSKEVASGRVAIVQNKTFDLVSYLARFEWDMAKYPVKQPLKTLTDSLSKQLSQIDTDLKTRAHTYNNIKANLQSLERKTVGNLLTRTLADIVNKEDFVLNSEYLITLLVVVPKTSYLAWQKAYESLSDMVVPRSTKMIAEDAEGGLFTVTLFRKVIDEFKTKARENKFIVREFYFNEREMQSEKDEIIKLAADKKQQYGPLLRWLKVNFSESFIAWTHIKALRVFVESVLRYGLPVNFQAVILHPYKKSMKRLRDVLNALFRHLDEAAAANMKDINMEIPGLQLNNQDYYPYVFFQIDLNSLDFES